MENKRKIRYLLFASVLFFYVNGFLNSSDRGHRLNQDRRSLQLKISEVRLALLQKDPELRELHERIVSLQKTLIKKLDSHPEMQSLQVQIKRIDEQLNQIDFHNQ